MRQKVTIITPTRNRGWKLLSQAIGCVRAQTFSDFRHIICTDGPRNEDIERLVGEEDGRFEYRWTGEPLGISGDGVRVQLLQSVKTDFVCFFDDDNLLLPTYLEKMIGALTDGSLRGESANFSICQCYHFGPLQGFHGKPPKVLSGIPPKLYFIDMMQCMLRTEEFRKFGFRNLGYYSDGHTYEAFAEKNAFIEVPEILCVHLNSH
jgi:glycosyltransferase involved in cell wall biosynthesis